MVKHVKPDKPDKLCRLKRPKRLKRRIVRSYFRVNKETKDEKLCYFVDSGTRRPLRPLRPRGTLRGLSYADAVTQCREWTERDKRWAYSLDPEEGIVQFLPGLHPNDWYICPVCRVFGYHKMSCPRMGL